MDRASNAEKAERLNHARGLLRRFEHLPDAVERMVLDCSVSTRQAYRYLQQAQRLKQDVPGHGFKDCFHGETFRKVGGTSPCLCRHERLVVERHRESSVGSFADSREKAWVIDHEVVTTRYSWNINLIVCYRQNWNKCMTY
jgi:hypothetical protein